MAALVYLLFALPFLMALVAGLLMPVLLVLLYYRFRFGMALVCLTFLIDTFTMGDAALDIAVNLYYPDIGLGLAMVAALLRLFFAPDFPHRQPAWLVFSILVAISLLSGFLAFGTGAAVQARSYFYFVAAGLYAMSFPMEQKQVQRIFNMLAFTACAFVGLTIYRWVVYYAPINSLLPPGGTYNIDGPIRVTYSNHALVIAQVLVAAFFYASSAAGFVASRMFSPMLLGIVLALQHRSVWVAALAGIGARLLVGNSKDGSKLRQMAFLVAIAAITVVPLAFNEKLSGVTQQIGTGASAALSGEGTAGERLSSWQEIIKNWYGAGVRSIVIGQSFGTDNTRLVADSHGEIRKISYIAHNLYVQTLFNTGILGLIAYLAATWYVIAGLYRLSRNEVGGATTNVLLVLMVMQVVYYLPYGVDYLQGFLFGVAIAYVAGHRPSAIYTEKTVKGAKAVWGLA